MTTFEITNQAVKQLKMSERGREAGKFLFKFLDCSTVKHLDRLNGEAVAALVNNFMLGTRDNANQVAGELKDLNETEP